MAQSAHWQRELINLTMACQCEKYRVPALCFVDDCNVCIMSSKGCNEPTLGGVISCAFSNRRRVFKLMHGKQALTGRGGVQLPTSYI